MEVLFNVGEAWVRWSVFLELFNKGCEAYGTSNSKFVLFVLLVVVLIIMTIFS